MPDAFVRCDRCGTSKRVNFGYCMQHGWPECCGQTMRLVNTQADIDAIMAEAVRPIKGFFNA